MPTQDRVRREQRTNLVERLVSEALAFAGQASPLLVGQWDPFKRGTLSASQTRSADTRSATVAVID